MMKAKPIYHDFYAQNTAVTIDRNAIYEQINQQVI